MDNWIQFLSLNVAIFGVFILPATGFFYHKLKNIEGQVSELKAFMKRLQAASDAADAELSKNWIQFYYNEIMKFMERLDAKSDRIPTKEHYRSVFENYKHYKALGGNGYIDIVMEQIEDLYKRHYPQDKV